MTREEAIKIVKDLYDKSLFLKKDKEAVRTLIPEVEESEDEKIRKGLINAFKEFLRQNDYDKDTNFKGVNTKDAIAWLEKQGEQKPNYCHHEVDLSGCSEEYRKAYYDGWNNCNQQHAQLDAEQKSTGCPEYCVMSNCANCPYRPVLIKKPNKWKQENTSDLTDFENVMMHIGDSFFGKNAGLDPNDTNAIKEQASILLGLVLQQEWNYNDEIIIETIIQEIEKIPSEKFIDNAKYKCLDWLRYRIKSLRPQSQWKPSDEQMDVLNSILNYETLHLANATSILASLYEDLKKLLL